MFQPEKPPRLIERRGFLLASGAVVVGLIYELRQALQPVHADPTPLEAPKPVTIVEFTDDGQQTGVVSVLTIRKTESAWRKQLAAASFEVTRHAGTEMPFSGRLLNVHDKGVFRCIACDTALFDSATKFESGTGWPSFWAPIAKENIVEKRDNSFDMIRTAVACRRCDSHIGHVFDDGPAPTGLRYCMNSVAMRFAKAS